MQPEARIGHRIRKFIEEEGGFIYKNHGSSMMMAGLPDLVGCINGIFIGIEVKQPGRNATKVQEHVLEKIRRAGGVAFVAHSVEEVQQILLPAVNAVITLNTPPM
jgi:Holliday junction resolvase